LTESKYLWVIIKKKINTLIISILQELKGNIRVFCRVRPLLADESCSAEGKIFSYPTSMETSGRAIDLAQNGISVVMMYLKLLFFFLVELDYVARMSTHVALFLFLGQKHAFTFDKVFTPEASQEEVFVEISQLVQSALDGYKVVLKFFWCLFNI